MPRSAKDADLVQRMRVLVAECPDLRDPMRMWRQLRRDGIRVTARRVVRLLRVALHPVPTPAEREADRALVPEYLHAPVRARRRGRAPKMTRELVEVFLGELARHGTVTRAAAAVRLHRDTVYRWRQQDPDFARAWDDALEAFADGLEYEAYRRAVEGYRTRPIMRDGEIIDWERAYSDRLLELLLRAKRPQVYRQATEVHVSGGVDHRHAVYDLRDDELLAIATRARGDGAVIDAQPVAAGVLEDARDGARDGDAQ